MDLIVFKVVFRAFEQFEKKKISLSFQNIDSEKPIEVSSELISKLRNLSETNQDTINFQNIEEVIHIGNPKVNYIFNYYLVILFTFKSSGKKLGYLIGNVKKLGDLLIGIWPFNMKNTTISQENIEERLDDIIKKPPNYDKICLISQ